MLEEVLRSVVEGIDYKAAHAEQRRAILSFLQMFSFSSQGEVGKVFAFMLSFFLMVPDHFPVKQYGKGSGMRE